MWAQRLDKKLGYAQGKRKIFILALAAYPLLHFGIFWIYVNSSTIISTLIAIYLEPSLTIRFTLLTLRQDGPNWTHKKVEVRVHFFMLKIRGSNRKRIANGENPLLFSEWQLNPRDYFPIRFSVRHRFDVNPKDWAKT